ncbi:hypothetical protein ACFQY4_34730 [Catellatospora bangladeshensis]|nr:hypothetical protein [Catellatospora bangladeshensis]
MGTLENTTNGPEETAIHGVGQGEGAIAVFGQGAAVGVRGDGATWHGVAGLSTSSTGGAGVFGHNANGPGVIGESPVWMGVYGKTDSTTGGAGVMGEGVTGGPGVIGKSQKWHGVYGETFAAGATGAAAVWGENKADGSGVVGHSQSGAGIYAKSEQGPAAVLDGRVEVIGELQARGRVEVLGDLKVHRKIEVVEDILLQGGDVAELFDVTAAAEPGTLMSAVDGGRIAPSDTGYDRRVVGVVAGAGQFRPGMILTAGCEEGAQPIAMIGRVICKVDASYGPIEVGDLLTTSPTPGHAMKAADQQRAFGAVFGKALAGHADGPGMIAVMVGLR